MVALPDIAEVHTDGSVPDFFIIEKLINLTFNQIVVRIQNPPRVFHENARLILDIVSDRRAGGTSYWLGRLGKRARDDVVTRPCM
jgi:hypothetical protein